MKDVLCYFSIKRQKRLFQVYRCISILNFISISIFLAKLLQGGVPPVLSKSYIKRLTVTDGLGDPLKGICVFFVRPNNIKQVSTSSIVEVHLSGLL